ncbi:MAG TPA: protein-tyrosine-phosphatase [Alphaproteobacteria bacterium]|nr:protein-tyrosine-phosphatase [Alphaproteobacteria bacterium]HAJ45911.1 protein-tyrosine-phosphatase [Alphaproteobacteria bacterium]
MASADTELPGAVLFACSFNAVRSPMAAALARYLLAGRVYVESAGVRAGELDPLAVEALDEVGIDMSGHRPHTFEDLSDSSFDLIISLSPEAHHKAVDMTRTNSLTAEYWPTLDPTVSEGSREQRLQAYRQVRDQLIARIKRRFPAIPMAAL